MKSFPRLTALVVPLLSLSLAVTACNEEDDGDDAAADVVNDVADVADVADTGVVTDTGLADTGPVDASDAAGACPATTPDFSAGCSTEGLSCGFGQECCCGQCYASTSCTCSDGQWACHATDACFIPACPDATDDATDADADADASAACETARDALAGTLYAKQQAFSVIVRLDHDTRAVLGYAIVAGAYAHVDESMARAAAQSATGFGSSGQNLAGADPADDWVFYESPGDFGGVGVVSAHSGLAVFGGGIVWSGAGDITHPASWSPASELASGCPASGGLGTTRGFDLVTGGALPAADVKAATDVVLTTAVPSAVWQGGYAFDAVVLRYPRTVGELDPTTAEWVVIVNGGWLE
ncbi:MAG: hypothetical protein H6745_17990 [Deltaproteobacteria bacterium]|nr:hypothetical protein [Deltaproteobacteria bacterium]